MRKIAILLTILFTLIMYSCSLFLPEEDETGPEITLESPSSGDILAEMVTVTCIATDDAGVAGAELFIDHTGTGLIDTTAPYSFEWDTEDYEDGSSHIMYVQGWDENDNYAHSDTITVSIDNSSIHPSPVDDINVSFLLPGNMITWGRVDHEKFVSYTLLRSQKANMDSSLLLFTSITDSDTLYLDTLANPLITYFYQVMVLDNKDHVSIGSITQSPSPEQFAPRSLTATVSDTTIRLRWTDQSSFEDGFLIIRDEGEGYQVLATVASDVTEYIDVEMEYDKQYRYEVAIFHDDVYSNFSSTAIQNSPLEFAPSNIAAMSTPQTIQVRWDDNCNFEEGYRLERDAGLGWVPLVELAANVTTFEDTALTYDIYYKYRVAAFTATMQSDYSTYYGIYSPLLFSPTNLALTLNDTSIVLTWEDRCLFETGFIIERGEGSITGYGYVALDTVAANIVTYTDFTIEEDAWYYYRVAAYTPEERSTYSSTSGISSPLNFAPTYLTATAVDTSIQLRWTDNCIFEDGFVLERDEGTGFEVIAELGEDISGYLDSGLELQDRCSGKCIPDPSY